MRDNLARAAWLLVAGSVPAAALMVAGGHGVASAVYLIGVLVCVLAGGAGIRHNLTTGHRRPWLLLLGAQAVSLIGESSRMLLHLVLLPNLGLLLSYLLLAAGVLDLLRRSRAADDEPARVDAVLLGVGSALVVWSLWIEPWIAGDDTHWQNLVAAALPMVTAALVVIVLPMLLLGRAGTPALWFFTGSGLALLTADVVLAVRGWFPTGPHAIPLHVVGAISLLAYAANSACMLHPTVAVLTRQVEGRSRRLRASRTAAIAAALCAPTVLTVVAPPTTTRFALVRAVLSIALIATAVSRIVRSNNSRDRAERQARWQADHDALTGLPNRDLLVATIAGWPAVSVLYLDLDRFQLINDHWGHEVGDELLRAVAGRIRAEVHAEDLVCRVGGDEFIVAVAAAPPPRAGSDAEALAARLLTVLAAPVPLSVGAVDVTASIGIAHSPGRPDPVELLRDADTAAYRAKDAGRNRAAVFDPVLRERVRTRMALEQALRGALANGELDVHYQPIIDLRTGRVDGYEALMRWTHPSLGAVSPVDFIPVAEDTGLIVPAGAWLLEEAATRLVHWRTTDATLHVSVNLAVRQLLEPGLPDRVRDILARTGLPPAGLWLEVTESGLMTDLDTCLDVLYQLRALGVTLCIDDFGTGYSSLSYLQRLPVAIVKVDRAFIAGVGEGGANESIVRAVLAMSQALGHRVVAEGVETAVQRDWLHASGCDFGQGWLFGRPQPADAVRRPAEVR
ncbi:hypothetical protein GCM10010168_30280 [Actinoplanes ianthinogenes]|uniref:Diguanylate cyclase (GGDEF)-like protein n=1 Tax=Actinoplanes ianthinogenes TaxID=122358 RepID=A0ABN6C3U1_9ACTN|nr:EAL domain-containing protein [Actinoplanes ianthinogenes]BCJ40170.1 hypothetical protein Aiant_08270 [Actinoplanes ianthinogenes]GGR10728.1 hypothetical protein GCM10010168_30280 [Actinoplanes ianthinogenes]